jgi:hypothetical protein
MIGPLACLSPAPGDGNGAQGVSLGEGDTKMRDGTSFSRQLTRNDTGFF